VSSPGQFNRVAWRRRLFLGIVAAACVAALAWAFRPVPLMVQVEPVTRGPLQVSVVEEGRTRIVDRFAISAPIPGVMCRLDLEVGDRIARDQPICALKPLRSGVLDPRSRAEAESLVAAAQARLQAAREAVAAADAAADLADTELRRFRQLAGKGDISREDLDRAAAEARAAAANRRSAGFDVERAQHELEAARTLLTYSGEAFDDASAERVVIRSPVDGQVLRLYRESEGVIAAGSPIVEIGDPRALEVAVDVLSTDAVRIHPGTRVVFERWGGEPLEGRVRVVEPSAFTKVSALGVEEQRVWVIADLLAPPVQWERLGDGYRVDARFILWEADDVLQVPASALFRSGAGWAVFVAVDGRTRVRAVGIGQRNDLRAQVLDGLAAGERVIAHPPTELEDGGRVVFEQGDG
jgi:HlyD family secretion protein